MSNGLDEFLAEALPDFDSVLAARGIGLPQRAFRSSILIVKHCIVRIQGDTKDDYLNKAWFGVLFQAVNKWYEKRYGEALQSKKPSITTIVLAFSTPFKAEVPLTINEPPQSDKTFWLCFPNDVQPDEDPMEWIVNPPNFDSTTSDEQAAVSSALVEVASHLRATHINLMTADHDNERSHSLAQGILPYLEKGAIDIARAEPANLSMAVWDLNFACEMAIKTFLCQRSLDPPNTHDIHQLHRLAVDHFGPNELDGSIGFLPSGKVAVKHRYTEITSPTITDALSIYRSALNITDGYSRRLLRKFTFHNTKFQLQLPPWFDQV